MIISSARRTPWTAPIAVASAAAIAAAIVGVVAAWHYHRLGLTLSHYDARGHLVVARRIIDSITPGWQQIGAVWLPLPHLLNAIPVQVDLFYRTGASAVAISIASYAVAAGAIAWIVATLTGSAAAAAAGVTVFALNPNVLYLQSTPMTEPLLLATTTLAVALIMGRTRSFQLSALPPSLVANGSSYGGPVRRAEGATAGSPQPPIFLIGWAFALACLTRYEAWPVTISALVAAAWARWRRGQALDATARDVASIAVYPALAVVAFAVFSRVVIGEWFLSNGFFVPENKALGDPAMALAEIGWGVRMLSGPVLTWLGAAGLALTVGLGLAVRRRGDALLVLSLLAMAAIPWTAFLKGHPYRIRYMVPLVAVEAIGAGCLAGIVPWRRARVACAFALVALVAYELRPLDATAPMVVEAQWDRPNAPVRARVTECLGRPAPGVKIMASMGSLGHYMQEASRSGLAIRDFLHEGNGDIWLAALDRPRPFVDWIVIEEKAEGGDMLARLARAKPSFLADYERVCEGAGLALYRIRN